MLGPWTSVGHDEVIKMDYFISLGDMSGDLGTMLAWTTSYEIGVSLSEIRWGFYNGADGGEESAHLEFTLHDISGQTLALFIEARMGGKIIYFLGPTSSGFPWIGGQFAAYNPIPDKCSIEFSQTQGFTYKFAGRPIGQAIKTHIYACPHDITIYGLDEKNQAHANTFEDYLKELAWRWNSTIADNPEKSPKAQIEFTWDPSNADNDAAMKQYPIIIEKEEGQTLSPTGSATAKIQPYKISRGVSIADAVKALWNLRFKPSEAGDGVDKGSQLEVNFSHYMGGKTFIDVKCHRKTVTDNTAVTLPVCIGSDKVCKGFPFRAQMAAINFPSMLINVLAASKHSPQKGMADQESAQAGNTGTAPVAENPNKHTVSETTQVKQTVSSFDASPGWPASNNNMFDGWGQLGAILNKYKVPEFTIDIDMPYTYAFTPVIHGGMLLDGVAGHKTGAMDYKNGVRLFFWWYIDPNCQDMLPVREISTDYRITKVIHTIGLSGNTTQVSLSHLTVSTNK